MPGRLTSAPVRGVFGYLQPGSVASLKPQFVLLGR